MAQSKVLIVEDDEGLREALVDTLALAGYEWLEADCAEDALLKLKSNTVDIVVSDVQMAGMGGLALLKNIKQNWPNLPVLLMTAYANIEDAVSAMKDGAIDYMAKPFAPEVLLNMVSRYAPIKSDDNGDAVVADEKSLRLLALADQCNRDIRVGLQERRQFPQHLVPAIRQLRRPGLKRQPIQNRMAGIQQPVRETDEVFSLVCHNIRGLGCCNDLRHGVRLADCGQLHKSVGRAARHNQLQMCLLSVLFGSHGADKPVVAQIHMHLGFRQQVQFITKVKPATRTRRAVQQRRIPAFLHLRPQV